MALSCSYYPECRKQRGLERTEVWNGCETNKRELALLINQRVFTWKVSQASDGIFLRYMAEELC